MFLSLATLLLLSSLLCLFTKVVKLLTNEGFVLQPGPCRLSKIWAPSGYWSSPSIVTLGGEGLLMGGGLVGGGGGGGVVGPRGRGGLVIAQWWGRGPLTGLGVLAG